MQFIRFLKNWTLPLGMTSGAAVYLTLSHIEALAPYKSAMSAGVSVVQPLLIFLMLFLTFCRVSPSDFRLRRWHIAMLLLQCAATLLIALPLCVMPPARWHVILEGAMLCLVCPTATAAAVVTRRLGGDVASVTTYTILINTLVALLLPALLPWIHPETGASFAVDLLRIAGHTFPMLVVPMLLSLFLRRCKPSWVEALAALRDLPFYLWTVSLSLAIAVTTRSIVHSHTAVSNMLGLALVSLVACAIQFALGRRLGGMEGDTVSATQACGQKNTVFIIWLGYTFLSPITSLAGGFYSIWHNVYNSYQLYRQRKAIGA
ncbi:MAG: transporter [Bacteroidaceae bacterium]|nr:transporter [Bacteroidaceae bacterium]